MAIFICTTLMVFSGWFCLEFFPSVFRMPQSEDDSCFVTAVTFDIKLTVFLSNDSVLILMKPTAGE